MLVIKITAALPVPSQGECCCHSLAEGKAEEIYFFCNAFTLQRNQGEIKPIITVLKSKIYTRRIRMQFVGRLCFLPLGNTMKIQTSWLKLVCECFSKAVGRPDESHA